MYRLDPRVVSLWRLRSLVRLATFWLPVAGGIGFFLGTRFGLPVAVSVGASLVAFQGVIALVWPALRFAAFRYDVVPAGLTVSSGVMFRATVSVPRQRIQFVDVRQSPLERARGLATVLFYTAAGPVLSGALPGVSAEEAERLRNTVMGRAGDAGV